MIPDNEILAMSFQEYNTFLRENKLSSNNSQTEMVKKVGKDIQFAVEGSVVSFNELENYIKAKVGPASGYPEPPTISLHVDQSVAMEHVVKVMNIAKNNEYRLILATRPVK